MLLPCESLLEEALDFAMARASCILSLLRQDDQDHGDEEDRVYEDHGYHDHDRDDEDDEDGHVDSGEAGPPCAGAPQSFGGLEEGVGCGEEEGHRSVFLCLL